MNLEIGNTYYQITYSDPELTMPGIKPVVYIGTDILDEKSENLLFFQDTPSFIKYGIATKANLIDSINCSVITASMCEVGVSILELRDLPQIVNECIQKANDLGNPKLQVLKGKWVQ